MNAIEGTDPRDALRALAEKATTEQVHPANWSHHVRLVLMAGPARDFMEAASPTVVLGLLDRIATLEDAIRFGDDAARMAALSGASS